MATRTLQQTPSISYDESVTDTLRITADFTIIDRDLATPPGSPAEGDKYLVAASGTGDWSGQDGNIAIYINSTWTFFTPSEGDLMWVEDENVLLVNDGSAFRTLLRADQNLADVASAVTAFNNIKQLATTSAAGVVEKATTAEGRSRTADKFLDAGAIKDIVAPPSALADGATIGVNYNAFVYDRVTIAGDRTIGNPTNAGPGEWRYFEVVGNNATARTLSFGSEYEVAPTLDDITSTKSYLVSIVCMASGRFRAYADEGGDPT